VAPAGGTAATGLRPHLAFFDRDGDAAISLAETRTGLSRLGFGRLLAGPGSLAIHLGVAGLALVGGRLVNPFALDLDATGKTRHPDLALVDADGAFDPSALRTVFARYGKRFGGEALTTAEVCTMIGVRVVARASLDATALPLLPLGLAAAAVEWIALLWTAGSTRDGVRVLEREAVRRFYEDPRFFDAVADRIATERQRRETSWSGCARNVLQAWIA
jgi:hypothetical protein